MYNERESDMTNEHNFKVGDRVRVEDSRHSFTVVKVDNYGCVIQGKSGKRLWVAKGNLYLTT